ncbi:MAG TPA: PGPGW domain-containing protein [Geobacteraceae bacterium]|nr:PGPGW domain-containing protein [Geobacteraceae bacterium]
MVARTLKKAKRIIIAVLGGTVVAIGIAMIVLPGPAVVVIPAGFAILATEFLWAKKLLTRAKERIGRFRTRRNLRRLPSET